MLLTYVNSLSHCGGGVERFGPPTLAPRSQRRRMARGSLTGLRGASWGAVGGSPGQLGLALPWVGAPPPVTGVGGPNG